jgi:hypothetical protein
VQASGFLTRKPSSFHQSRNKQAAVVKVSAPETDDVAVVGIRELVEALNAHAGAHRGYCLPRFRIVARHSAPTIDSAAASKRVVRSFSA